MPGVAEQALDVPLVEARDLLEVEAREGPAEGLALAQDRQPREPGLEALEAQLLEQAPVVADREAPFVVVVGAVLGVESAHQQRARPSSPTTIPSGWAGAPVTDTNGNSRRRPALVRSTP